MFKEGQMTLGLFFPIESYTGPVPLMDLQQQIESAKLAERYGFSALFFRDVFLNVPSFGDTGHIYDPWVFMGYVMAHTSRIALATGSIVSTLRHPLHVAKAAASADHLSGGRLVLGLATGTGHLSFRLLLHRWRNGKRFSESHLKFLAGSGAKIFPTFLPSV